MMDFRALSPLSQKLGENSPFSEIKLPKGLESEAQGIKQVGGVMGFMLLSAIGNSESVAALSSSPQKGPEYAQEYAERSLAVIKQLAAVVEIARSAADYMEAKLPGDQIKAATDHVEDVCKRVYDFVLDFNEKFKPSAAVSKLGVTAREILTHLYFDGSATMTELAKEVHLSTAAITGQIDRLEKLEVSSSACISLVERTNVKDRRVNMTKITAEGKAIAAQITLLNEIKAILREA